MIIEKDMITRICIGFITKELKALGYTKENAVPIVLTTYNDDYDNPTVREYGDIFVYCIDGKVFKYSFFYFHKEQSQLKEVKMVKENHGYTWEQLKVKFEEYKQKLTIC